MNKRPLGVLVLGSMQMFVCVLPEIFVLSVPAIGEIGLLLCVVIIALSLVIYLNALGIIRFSRTINLLYVGIGLLILKQLTQDGSAIFNFLFNLPFVLSLILGTGLLRMEEWSRKCSLVFAPLVLGCGVGFIVMVMPIFSPELLSTASKYIDKIQYLALFPIVFYGIYFFYFMQPKIRAQFK